MTRFNQITAHRAAMGLSLAMFALVATTGAGHAQTKNGLKINVGQGSRQIVVERANGNKTNTGNKTTFLVPPKATPAKQSNNPPLTAQFVPPKATPAKQNNNPPVTAQFVPPKATPVKSSGNGGGNQLLKFEAPKAPRVSAQPKVKVAANTPAAQVALAPEVKPEAKETTPETEAEAAPAPEATPKVKVIVTAPRSYHTGYAPYPRYYGSYGSYGSSYGSYGSYGGGYSHCH